jgi:hypothetical protein
MGSMLVWRTLLPAVLITAVVVSPALTLAMVTVILAMPVLVLMPAVMPVQMS